MERFSVKALRMLASDHDIDIHSLLEKTDIAQKIRSELAKKFRIAEEKVHEHLAQASTAGGASPVQAGDATSSHLCSHAGSLVVAGDASSSRVAIGAGTEVDYVRTRDLVQTFREALRINNDEASRFRLLNVWQSLPDGAGRWCFTQPGADGPPLFYPVMARSNLALAFECPRWNQRPVVLDPFLVLCWCPAGYVWPYCMFCHKFCFPYDEGEWCHRRSKKHLDKVAYWRSGREMVRSSLESQPRFDFFML